MAYILTLEIADEADLKLLLEIARRIGVKATVKQVANELSVAEQHQLLDQVFGAWQSDVNGEEMAKTLHADRQDTPRAINL